MNYQLVITTIDGREQTIHLEPENIVDIQIALSIAKTMLDLSASDKNYKLLSQLKKVKKCECCNQISETKEINVTELTHVGRCLPSTIELMDKVPIPSLPSFDY